MPRIRPAAGRGSCSAPAPSWTAPSSAPAPPPTRTAPLLLMASAWDSPARDTMWDTLWPHLTGWHRRLTLTHSGHLSYCDLQLLIPQGQAVFAWPADQLQHFLGTGDPHRAVQAQRAYLTAYFGLHLRGTAAPLLDAPSPRRPEIVFDA
ncbi:GAG-pre-integrase domain-containing protein [Kitasatospora sp. NPDC086791]|uniref:GAG-pre-integrase domain-containing protein n=1 Tax=Kitasatospora sp. NPDC086791 TaxID=3155178 RepID=UPI00341EC125